MCRIKKFFCLLVVASILTGGVCAAAESARVYAVDMETSSVLVTVDGSLVTQVGAYASLYKLTEAGYPAERELFEATKMPPEGAEIYQEEADDADTSPEDYACALMDAGGNLLTDFSYTYFVHYPELGIVVYCDLDELVGVMDEKGNVLIPAAYGALEPNGVGGYIATPVDTFKSDGDDYAMMAELALLDASGNRTDTGVIVQPYMLSGYFEGLMPVYMMVDEAWLYGYVDTQGKIAIDARFEVADRFLNGYAAVCEPGEGYGLITPDGQYALAPSYESIEYGWTAGNTIVAKRDETTVDFINLDTLQVVGSYQGDGTNWISCYSLTPGVFYLSDGDATFVCGENGEVLYKVSGDDNAYIYGSGDNLNGTSNRLMLSVGDWPQTETYLISLTGEKIAGPYCEISLVLQGGETGRFMTTTYQIITVEIEGQQLQDVDTDSMRYGIIDENGNTILPAEYQQLWYLENGRYWAEKDGVYGIIDETGAYVAQIS